MAKRKKKKISKKKTGNPGNTQIQNVSVSVNTPGAAVENEADVRLSRLQRS